MTKKRKKEYSRGYKILVTLLFLLISLAMSLVLWEITYYLLICRSWVKLCVAYSFMAIANLGISVNLINLIMTGAHKRPLLCIIDTRPKKAIFALSIFVLALYMTIICNCWYFCF